MQYKACLFDMNGVLVDDEQLQEAAFRNVLGELGYTLTPADYLTYFIGKTDQNGFEDYFAAHAATHDIQPLIAKKGVEYQKLAAGKVTGYPGVSEFIEVLASRGMKLAIVTSSMRAEAEAVLDGLGVRTYFSVIVAAEDVTNGKPDPEGYLQGAERLHVLPVDCLVIEDTLSGIRAAHAANMKVLAITNTHTEDELREANVIVNQLSGEILPALGL